MSGMKYESGICAECGDRCILSDHWDGPSQRTARRRTLTSPVAHRLCAREAARRPVSRR
jgi:hypothetical protein